MNVGGRQQQKYNFTFLVLRLLLMAKMLNIIGSVPLCKVFVFAPLEEELTPNKAVSNFDLTFIQVSLFVTFVQRVEKESRQKKATAARVKLEKEEDPYGGSTDENTDAEAEEDHPIPELPGMPRFVLTAMFCLSALSALVPVTGTHVPLCSWTTNSDRK